MFYATDNIKAGEVAKESMDGGVLTAHTHTYIFFKKKECVISFFSHSATDSFDLKEKMIRKFEKSDQQEVCNLVLSGLSERWGAEFDPSYNRDIMDIHGYYIERHHATVVILEVDTMHQQLQHQKKQLKQNHEQQQHKAVVGCGILLPLPAEDVYDTWCAEPPSRVEKLKGLHLCRMMRLSVSKEYRGKGYAKKLIQHLIEAAREQGFDKILVETETLWSSAVQIYKAMGFTVVEDGEETVHFEYDL